MSKSLSAVKDLCQSEEEAPVKPALFKRQLNTWIIFHILCCFSSKHSQHILYIQVCVHAITVLCSIVFGWKKKKIGCCSICFSASTIFIDLFWRGASVKLPMYSLHKLKQISFAFLRWKSSFLTDAKFIKEAPKPGAQDKWNREGRSNSTNLDVVGVVLIIVLFTL